MAVTPQQGWSITGEINLEGVDYWIISNSNDTIGYNVDLATVGNYSYGGTLYYHFTKVWQGFSQYDWAIDSDWIIKATVSSFTPSNCYLFVADRNYMANVVNSSSVIANGEIDNGYIYIETSPTNPGSLEYPMEYAPWGGRKLTQGVNYLTLNNIGYYAGGHNNFYPRILINDLIIAVSSNVAQSNTSNTSAKLAFVFLCPKIKAPSGMKIGDEWPKLRAVPIDGSNIEEYQKEWSNNLESVYQQSTADRVAIDASVQKEIANEANTGAVGSFEISEQQIDTIAGWFHNSFVFQWFSMFVLMFVLLFFIKKGMA